MKTGIERFEKLRNYWKFECERKNDLTLHRKEQLIKILNDYGGNKVPFEHFLRNDDTINNIMYPVICAFHIGYFEITDNDLILKDSYKNNLGHLNIDTSNLQRIRKNRTEKITRVFQTGESNIATFVDLKKELERRKNILIRLAHSNISINMGSFERNRIIELFEKERLPKYPKTVPLLLKHFCVSSFSYAPLRNNFLKPLIGDIPSTENIDRILSLVFEREEFLDTSYWTPENLLGLAENIQSQKNYNLYSKEFKQRIISVLLTGMLKMQSELENGLVAFYSKIESIKATDDMIKLSINFSKSIRNVGPVLISDFFKNIGFTNYVKIDHHFQKEFNTLVVFYTKKKKLNFKESFTLSQIIAKKLNYSPYYIDALLYFWGKYGKFESAVA